MTLDELLAPIKWTDEQILRQYTSFVKNYEAKGRSRYWLCVAADFVFLYAHHGIGLMVPDAQEYWKGPKIIPNLDAFLIIAPDFVRNLEEYYCQKKNYSTEELVQYRYKSGYAALSKFSSKYLRLPLMMASAGFLGTAIMDFYGSIREGDPLRLKTGLGELEIAVGLFSMSSSMYIKDADPNILKKEPFWQKAYTWLKAITSPQPKPVPIKY